MKRSVVHTTVLSDRIVVKITSTGETFVGLGTADRYCPGPTRPVMSVVGVSLV